MYHEISHLKAKHCAQKLYLCVPHAAYNRQRQFSYTALFHSFMQMRRSELIMRFGITGIPSMNYHRHLTTIHLIPFRPSQDDVAAPGLEIVVLLGYIPSSLGYCCPVFRDSVVTSPSWPVDTAQYPKRKQMSAARLPQPEHSQTPQFWWVKYFSLLSKSAYHLKPSDNILFDLV